MGCPGSEVQILSCRPNSPEKQPKRLLFSFLPAGHMKMKPMQIVPLSEQAFAVLEVMKPISQHRSHVFPGYRSPQEPMNSQTANMALKRDRAGRWYCFLHSPTLPVRDGNRECSRKNDQPLSAYDLLRYCRSFPVGYCIRLQWQLAGNAGCSRYTSSCSFSHDHFPFKQLTLADFQGPAR